MNASYQITRERQYLPTIRIKDLQINKVYQVTKVKKVSTRYGEKIVFEPNREYDIFIQDKYAEAIIQNEAVYNGIKKNINFFLSILKYIGDNNDNVFAYTSNI